MHKNKLVCSNYHETEKQKRSLATLVINWAAYTACQHEPILKRIKYVHAESFQSKSDASKLIRDSGCEKSAYR